MEFFNWLTKKSSRVSPAFYSFDPAWHLRVILVDETNLFKIPNYHGAEIHHAAHAA
ncbi:hypothetical protein V4C53_01750 [Paraburkholderia azotifigens]|uniref:hypothetical protein n=1 Tax=Paraburkholderia azotifigens TaxID=2057004 RepID=UPI00317491BB